MALDPLAEDWVAVRKVDRDDALLLASQLLAMADQAKESGVNTTMDVQRSLELKGAALAGDLLVQADAKSQDL